MSKLYLSSCGIPDTSELEDLLGLPLPSVKAALIANAKDYYAPLARTFKVRAKMDNLCESSGLNFTEIDLRQYDSADEVTKALEDFNLVWVAGGNTFCLRYEMHRSGFDTAIPKLLERGLVWGGDSAGAVVAGPTLKGVELSDEPTFSKKTIWQGVNITKTIIMPHADNPDFNASLTEMRILNLNNPNYIELNDNQALIYNSGQVRLVTGGANKAKGAP